MKEEGGREGGRVESERKEEERKEMRGAKNPGVPRGGNVMSYRGSFTVVLVSFGGRGCVLVSLILGLVVSHRLYYLLTCTSPLPP